MLEQQQEFTMEKEYPLVIHFITENKAFALTVQNQWMKLMKEVKVKFG